MNPFMALAAVMLIGLFTIFDYIVTLSLYEKYGPKIELSPITRFLIKKFGLNIGAALGIVGVSFIVAASCVYFNWDHLLSAFIGARAWFFAFQGKSLEVVRKLEREMLKNAS